MTNDKCFKIVKIPSEYEVVINAGENYSITVGDKFDIYQTGEPVIDPDTGETLGLLDFIKDTVEATTVFEKMSICKKITITFNPITAALENAVKPIGIAPHKIIEKLNVDYKDLLAYENNPSYKIKIGDLVRPRKE